MVPCLRQALDATSWLVLITFLSNRAHAGCADTPNYSDRYGFGCSTYESIKWCQDGDIGAAGCK